MNTSIPPWHGQNVPQSGPSRWQDEWLAEDSPDTLVFDYLIEGSMFISFKLFATIARMLGIPEMPGLESTKCLTKTFQSSQQHTLTDIFSSRSSLLTR
jgi:hypothetical protein